MTRWNEPVVTKVTEPREEKEKTGRGARAAFGARLTRRPRPRVEGPPPTAALLSDRLQTECEDLRSALEAALSRLDHRVVMILSAVRDEGCTTVVAAMGFNLAVRGLGRVLLLDANLRGPQLHQILGIPNERGLSEVVSGRIEAGMAIVSTPFPGLSVMPFGAGYVLPAQLFGAQGVGSVLAAIREHYDYVLVDMPPLLRVPEGAFLGAEADGVVIVARAGRTKREALAKVKELLARSGSNVLGVVLNRRRYAIPSALYRRI